MGEPSVRDRSQDRHDELTKVAVGSGLSMVGEIVCRPLQMASYIIVARLLGPALYGLYTVGNTIARVGSIVSVLGLDNGIVYFGTLQRFNRSGLNDVLLVSMGFAALAGTGAAVSLYLAAPWLASIVFGRAELVTAIRLFAPAVPAVVLLRVASAGTRISQRMQFSVFAQRIFQPGVNLALLLVCCGFGLGLAGCAWAFTASMIGAAALSVYLLTHLFPISLHRNPAAHDSTAKLVKYSAALAVTNIAASFMAETDRLLIAYFCAPSEVGIYQGACNIAITLTLVLQALVGVMYPVITDLFSRGERDRINELFKISTKWAVYFSVPLFAAVCFAPDATMQLVYGAKYAGGGSILVILVLRQVFNTGAGPTQLFLVTTGYERRLTLLAIASLLLAIVLDLFLIRWYGAIGAAIAATVSTAVFYVWLLKDLRRTLGLWPYDRRFIKGGIAALISLAGLMGVRGLPIASTLVRLTMLSLVSGVGFYGSLWVLGLDDEDFHFLRMLAGKVASRSNRSAVSA